MKIHEYQGKEFFRRYQVPVPTGFPCLSLEEADDAIDRIDGGIWVVKAQIHAGGRGKGGGVQVKKTASDAKSAARDIMGMRLVTHQTGTEGQVVRRLLIEEGVAIAKEFYLALLVDRTQQKVAFIASPEGGMDIEKVAAQTPDKIHTLYVEATGFSAESAEQFAQSIGFPDSIIQKAVGLMANLYRLFTETDASLVEINPLVVTQDEQLIALDAKMDFDDNAAFRHPDYDSLRDRDEEDSAEREAAQYDLSYISLDGNIGCMVNGAGLAMATMDIIKFYGGEPANFLDVGGGATSEKVQAAFRLMLLNDKIRAILINIFGGIMRCDVIAEGVKSAVKEIGLSVPLIVRLEGTNVTEGRHILANSGLSIVTADSMSDAAYKSVCLAKGGQ